MSIEYYLSFLNGIYNKKFLKPEHQEFVNNNYVLEVPSDWSYHVVLVNLPIELSLSVNISGFGNTGAIIEFILDGKEIKISEFKDVDEILEVCKDYIPSGNLEDAAYKATWDVNDEYEKIKEQSTKLLKLFKIKE